MVRLSNKRGVNSSALPIVAADKCCDLVVERDLYLPIELMIDPTQSDDVACTLWNEPLLVLWSLPFSPPLIEPLTIHRTTGQFWILAPIAYDMAIDHEAQLKRNRQERCRHLALHNSAPCALEVKVEISCHRHKWPGDFWHGLGRNAQSRVY